MPASFWRRLEETLVLWLQQHRDTPQVTVRRVSDELLNIEHTYVVTGVDATEFMAAKLDHPVIVKSRLGQEDGVIELIVAFERDASIRTDALRGSHILSIKHALPLDTDQRPQWCRLITNANANPIIYRPPYSQDEITALLYSAGISFHGTPSAREVAYTRRALEWLGAAELYINHRTSNAYISIAYATNNVRLPFGTFALVLEHDDKAYYVLKSNLVGRSMCILMAERTPDELDQTFGLLQDKLKEMNYDKPLKRTKTIHYSDKPIFRADGLCHKYVADRVLARLVRESYRITGPQIAPTGERWNAQYDEQYIGQTIVIWVRESTLIQTSVSGQLWGILERFPLPVHPTLDKIVVVCESCSSNKYPAESRLAVQQIRSLAAESSGLTIITSNPDRATRRVDEVEDLTQLGHWISTGIVSDRTTFQCVHDELAHVKQQIERGRQVALQHGHYVRCIQAMRRLLDLGEASSAINDIQNQIRSRCQDWGVRRLCLVARTSPSRGHVTSDVNASIERQLEFLSRCCPPEVPTEVVRLEGVSAYSDDASGRIRHVVGDATTSTLLIAVSLDRLIRRVDHLRALVEDAPGMNCHFMALLWQSAPDGCSQVEAGMFKQQSRAVGAISLPCIVPMELSITPSMIRLAEEGELFVSAFIESGFQHAHFQNVVPAGLETRCISPQEMVRNWTNIVKTSLQTSEVSTIFHTGKASARCLCRGVCVPLCNCDCTFCAACAACACPTEPGACECPDLCNCRCPQCHSPSLPPVSELRQGEATTRAPKSEYSTSERICRNEHCNSPAPQGGAGGYFCQECYRGKMRARLEKRVVVEQCRGCGAKLSNSKVSWCNVLCYGSTVPNPRRCVTNGCTRFCPPGLGRKCPTHARKT